MQPMVGGGAVAWNQCWVRECRAVLEAEWGCAMRDAPGDDWGMGEGEEEEEEGSAGGEGAGEDGASGTGRAARIRRNSCETPYNTTLLQVRAPLSTVSSLVVKFCESLDRPVHPLFYAMASALWPGHDWSAAWGCVGTVAWTVSWDDPTAAKR